MLARTRNLCAVVYDGDTSASLPSLPPQPAHAAATSNRDDALNEEKISRDAGYIAPLNPGMLETGLVPRNKHRIDLEHLPPELWSQPPPPRNRVALGREWQVKDCVYCNIRGMPETNQRTGRSNGHNPWFCDRLAQEIRSKHLLQHMLDDDPRVRDSKEPANEKPVWLTHSASMANAGQATTEAYSRPGREGHSLRQVWSERPLEG